MSGWQRSTDRPLLRRPGGRGPRGGDASEIRSKAFTYLLEHGWTREQEEASDGSVCLIGALEKVTGYDPKRPRNKAALAYRRAYWELRSELGMDLDDWNDAPGRSLGHVLNALVDCDDLLCEEETDD